MGRMINIDELWKELEILYDAKNGEVTWNDALWKIKSASVVESTTQQWIPCSERLPEAENMYKRPKHRYLCQRKCANELFVGARLTDDIGRMKDWWDWYGTKIRDEDVIAWMPLPEPWKGEQK